MALYAFDGTGDRWNPNRSFLDAILRRGSSKDKVRWNPKKLRDLDNDAKKDLLATISDKAKTDKKRFLTNIPFFYKEYVSSGGHAEYFPGVGSGALFETNTGKTLDFILGGAFGIGALGIVNQAFKRLKKNIKEGDNTIDIVGYSRGAAIARVFADKIFADYKKLDKNLSEPPEIRFIGLFDTVASFGNPFNDNELFFQEYLPPTAKNVFHAMSLDFNQTGFGLDRAYGENVLEVWFRGGHGDIGGSAKNPGKDERNKLRTNITLNFMLKKFKAVSGLNIKTDYPVSTKSEVSLKETNIEKNNQGKLDPSRRHRNHDVFHYSIFDSNKKEIPHDGCIDLPPRDKLVIEELHNESQISELRLIQLTPDLQDKYPDGQSIYDKLYS